ncbi:MAG: HlyD family efflux transporter periplasmic adaptor subunit, partial [Thermodesulfobacteriota bacterium]
EILVWPPSVDDEDAILRAHGELGRLHGSGAICSVPLLTRSGEGYGAITFERSPDQPFTDETLRLCEAIASLLGPMLEEKHQNDRLLLWKINESFGRQLAKIFGPGHLTAKLLALCLTGVIVFFAYAQGDYRVSAITSLEGTIQRVITSPFDGYLFKADQRAGDVVEKGRLLAALDTRDFVLEQKKWASEAEQRTLEYRKALAENEIAMSSIIQEQINQSKSQLALLEEQIQRAHIHAPFDGILISGDLSQSIGSPVHQGEVLFEIAPLDSYRVMLEIDEKDIEQVVGAQKGELILNALPEVSFPFTVDKITPVSTTKEGRNYFIAEGHLLQMSDQLRPGMQGYGKIFIERRKLIWIWTHRLVDRVRLWFWTWLP